MARTALRIERLPYAPSGPVTAGSLVTACGGLASIGISPIGLGSAEFRMTVSYRHDYAMQASCAASSRASGSRFRGRAVARTKDRSRTEAESSTIGCVYVFFSPNTKER
jgi:hypothetical protein